MTSKFHKEPPIAIGCVTDANGPYAEQAARLLLSLRWLGGEAAQHRFILAVVGQLDDVQTEFFRRHGAEIIEVDRFDERHGPSNKLRFFELDMLDQFEHLVLLDCDTIVVQDPSQWLITDGFAAKPADAATVSSESLYRYLEDQGIEPPHTDYRYDVDDVPGLPYFNSGAIVLAGHWRAAFIDAWARFNRDLLERSEAFQIDPFYVDQASLTAALLQEGIPIEALPSRMNFPAHFALKRYTQAMYETDPVIIHYHWKTDSNGYVRRLPLPRVQQRATAFNARLRAERSKYCGPIPKRTDGGPKVIVGSGWWSATERSEWSIGSDRTRATSFFDLWYQQVVNCLAPEKILITDSASPNKPDHGAYPLVEWVELDLNYGHANDIRTGKIDTHWCGWTRSVLQGAVFALCCDADYFVYVEQDCLVKGRDFLAAAIGDSDANILLGARTVGGVGIGGKVAAPMFQNSLIIVRRDGLKRFIKGILGWKESDGEVSPEDKLQESCTPFDELSVPFGRSRPIDFDLEHLYAQHLTDDELEWFLATATTIDALSDERSIFNL